MRIVSAICWNPQGTPGSFIDHPVCTSHVGLDHSLDAIDMFELVDLSEP